MPAEFGIARAVGGDKRYRLGLTSLVALAASIAMLATAAPALADSVPCSGSTPDNVLTCVHFGWNGDSSEDASSARNQNSSGSLVLETCLWADNDTVRIGCSGYETVSAGNVIDYASGADNPPGTYRARTWLQSGGNDTEIADFCATN